MSTNTIDKLFAAYGGKDMPLPEYAALVATFGTLVAGLIGAAKRQDVEKRLGLGQLLLLGISTHKLSRLIAKDRVTSPFRAPFAKYVKDDGHGEVEEDSRGTGLQKAVGDLLTCPYCMCPWVAAALVAGLLLLPGPTKILCSILTSVALAHFLHQGYVALEESTK